MSNEDLVKEIIGRSLLLRVGAHVTAIIKARVQAGVFEDGSSTDAGQYSSKPFVMPIGAVKKKSVLMGILKNQYNEKTQLFRTKKGSLWVLVKDGYQWLREVSGKPSAKVDMRYTSEMMRSLKVLSVDPEKGEIIIGHDRKRNQQLAEWHHQGAGKSKKVRKWLYVTDKELQSIADGL